MSPFPTHQRITKLSGFEKKIKPQGCVREAQYLSHEEERPKVHLCFLELLRSLVLFRKKNSTNLMGRIILHGYHEVKVSPARSR